jgi:hypothetical protein
MPAEQMLLGSLQDTVAMRGFGLLSLHTQNFYAGSVLERTFPRLLQRIAQQRDAVWTPAGAEVTQWWRDREAVRMSVREETDALFIRLEIARGPISGLRLVLIPPDARSPRLEDAKGVRLQRLDEHRWAIVFPRLDKGAAQARVRF